MPLVFASDPAPQQLTAPCRKYSGRLHHPIEQPVYRPHFPDFGGNLLRRSRRAAAALLRKCARVDEFDRRLGFDGRNAVTALIANQLSVMVSALVRWSAIR